MGLNNFQNFSKIFAFVTLFSMLTSCASDDEDGSSGNPSASTIKSFFIDSVAQNLIVRGPDDPQGFSQQMTGYDGSFSCVAGEMQSFYVVDRFIGKGVCRRLITPKTLYPDEDQAINLGLLLLTLDGDGDPDNGLELSTKDISNFGVSDFSIIIADNSAVDTLVQAIYSDQLLNFANFPQYSREDVSDHFDEQGLESSGVYSGSFSVTFDNDGDDCDDNPGIEIAVAGDLVVIETFGNFDDGETDTNSEIIFFSGPRIVDSVSNFSTFAFNDDSGSGASDDCDDAQLGGVVSDRVSFANGMILPSGVLTSDYSSGVQCDNGYIEECAGTVTATLQ